MGNIAIGTSKDFITLLLSRRFRFGSSDCRSKVPQHLEDLMHKDYTIFSPLSGGMLMAIVCSKKERYGFTRS